MFDWLFGISSDSNNVDSLADSYWNDDADSAKSRYDSIRGANWADPDEWEQNLHRADAFDEDDSDD